MLDRLFDFVLRHRGLAILFALAVAAIGIFSVRHVPFDAYPDLTGNIVEVITTAPGYATEEVERLVTYPLESSLMGLPGAENVRSISKSGLSIITVTFPDRFDIHFARTLVQQRLNEAEDALPPGVEPALGPVSTPMGELYQYTLTSDSMSLTELKALHDYVIRPRLRTVPGVSEVNSWGGLTEQLHVVVDPARLAARGLTIADVHEALARNNATFGGAYLERGGERFTLRGLGRFENPDDVARTVIAAHDGVPVRVADVATVTTGAHPREGAVTQDGVGEVVSGMVMKLRGADSKAVIQGVRAKMAEIRASIPDHVRITVFYDQTELVSRTTGTIVKNLLGGGLLVIAVLFLFLGNVRASLIVASVIPLSMLMAFTAMHLFGFSANLMSLGALDFGLLVDASIVMVENFIRHLERSPGSERRPLFERAASEVGRPVLFGIAIIVAVYIPIFTLDSMEGRMFIPMAFTVVCAVLGSLLLALTYVPAISALLLRHGAKGPGRIQQKLRERYARALDAALRRPGLVVGSAVVAIVLAVGSLRYIGTEFMPELDEGAILITTIRIPSVSLEEATRLSLATERIVRSFPEVITAVTKEGRPDLATESMGLFEGDTYVILKPRKEWTTAKTREGLIEAFDSALADVPGLQISFTQPLAMRLDEAESGIQSDLGIKVFGPDLEENHRWAERIRRIVASTPGAADVGVEISEGTGQLRLEIRRDDLARHGLAVEDVRQGLELAMGAQAATALVDGARRIDVVARYPDEARADPVALRRLLIRAPSGALVPIGAVADIVETTAPELIGHENAQRRAIVYSNVRGRDLGSFVRDVQERVARELDLPPGMFLEWGGQFENQQRAMERLRVVVPAALALICLLLYLSFGSVAQAALILTNVPFALVGGISMLWIRGLNLSLSASVGFIALFGIAVLNGVVLVAHLNDVRREVPDLEDAIRIGAADRLRPVLLTALVASLGFVPMALSTSPGAEVQRPLASVVIGGLITSTLLTLFVLPTLYLWLTRWQETRALGRARAPRREMEGAVLTPAGR